MTLEENDGENRDEDEEVEMEEEGREKEMIADAKNDKMREKVRDMEGKKGQIKVPTNKGSCFKLASVDVGALVTSGHPGVAHHLQVDEHVEVKWPVLVKGKAGKDNKDWEFTNGQNLLVSQDGKHLYKCISEAIADAPEDQGFFVHFSHIYNNN